MRKIEEWKASYYCQGTKTWIYGRLKIYTRCIRFLQDKEGVDRFDFRVFFEEFLELKKETTSVFFAAITVRVRADKYWFSSFEDRGHVFNTIEHFWKESLFASFDSEVPTNTELLSKLHHAQKTLTSAGRMVFQQGQQINSACANMSKIHNDLGVAETLIYNLDSWLLKWNAEIPCVHIEVPEKSTVIIKKSEYPIVYARTLKEKHLPGTLVVSNNKLEIFTAERSLDVAFVMNDITEVSVHTPWEMTISQIKIGDVGRTVHLIAARLVHILQTLEVLLPGKINYDDPPSDTQDPDDDELDLETVQDGDEVVTSCSGGHFQATNSRAGNPKSVTDAEAAEIGRVLKDIRGLALGIQDEQDRQFKQLDLLSDSIDKANERIRTDSRKVNKLM